MSKFRQEGDDQYTKHFKKSKSKQKQKTFQHVPDKDWILTKISHVNDAMGDLQAEVHDNQENKECHFLRILRVGPLVSNKATLLM
jgi:hypothetical protein